MERVRKVVPDVSFAFESGTRFGYEPSYATWAPDAGEDPAIFSGSVEEISRGEEFVKLLVQSQTVLADELLERVRAALGETATATHSATRDYGLVEVSARGVNKGAMLARVCGRLGMDARDVAAFGDMPNDVDMLTWAGQAAHRGERAPVLHASAFPPSPSNTESGVGRAIRAGCRDRAMPESAGIPGAAEVHPDRVERRGRGQVQLVALPTAEGQIRP